jgi:hypothetical protein
MRGQGGKGRENVPCMENIPLGKRLAALVKHGGLSASGMIFSTSVHNFTAICRKVLLQVIFKTKKFEIAFNESYLSPHKSTKRADKADICYMFWFTSFPEAES